MLEDRYEFLCVLLRPLHLSAKSFGTAVILRLFRKSFWNAKANENGVDLLSVKKMSVLFCQAVCDKASAISGIVKSTIRCSILPVVCVYKVE